MKFIIIITFAFILSLQDVNCGIGCLLNDMRLTGQPKKEKKSIQVTE